MTIVFDDGTEVDDGDTWRVYPAHPTPKARLDWLNEKIEKYDAHVKQCNCEFCDESSFLESLEKEKEHIIVHLYKEWANKNEV